MANSKVKSTFFFGVPNKVSHMEAQHTGVMPVQICGLSEPIYSEGQLEGRLFCS